MKGQLSDLALGIVVALVSLFIGLYIISTVADLQSMDSLYDYTYTTVTNFTTGIVNASQTHDVDFNLGFVDNTITDETAIKTISIIANNTGDNALTINATLNDASIGTFSALAHANTTGTFTNQNFVTNVVNNITVGGQFDSETNITILEVTIKYPSGNTSTTFGNIQSDLTTNSGTIFDVMILVIIIVALGVAIAVLRGFGGTKSTSPV